MTVLEKKAAGPDLHRIGTALLAALFAAALLAGLVMALNPRSVPVPQPAQDAPFLTDTETPSHQGRTSAVVSDDLPFMVGTESPTHIGRVVPMTETDGSAPFLADTDSPTHVGRKGS